VLTRQQPFQSSSTSNTAAGVPSQSFTTSRRPGSIAGAGVIGRRNTTRRAPVPAGPRPGRSAFRDPVDLERCCTLQPLPAQSSGRGRLPHRLQDRVFPVVPVQFSPQPVLPRASTCGRSAPHAFGRLDWAPAALFLDRAPVPVNVRRSIRVVPHHRRHVLDLHPGPVIAAPLPHCLPPVLRHNAVIAGSGDTRHTPPRCVQHDT